MRKFYTLLLIGSIVALCTSCATYRKYSRPEELPTDRLYGESVAVDDSSSLAAFSWREFFTDPELQALIEQGLTNNADLQIASLRVQEAEAALLASRLAYLPALSLVPQGSLSSFDGSKTAKTYSLALSADWEVELAGRLTNEKRKAVATVNQNRAYRQAVATQLVATIANSYFNLLMLDAQLDISRRTLAAWDETVRTLLVRKNVGESTEAAVAQAKADRQAVVASVLTLEQQVRQQENALCLLLGTTPRGIARTTLAEQTFPEAWSVGVPLQLLENRPDVRQAEYALQAAFYNVNGARAAFYPQLTLSGTAGWTNNSGAAIVNPGRWLLNALGQLTQPLFNKGQNLAALKIAKAQQEEALIAFRQSLLKAGSEVNDALTQWQTAGQRLKVVREQVETLRQTVAATRLLMQHSDAASYLEVLTAQQALLQAELTEAQDVFSQMQGIINLYHALGGGSD